MNNKGRIKQYTNPLILTGETLCKETKNQGIDKNNHTHYIYVCPYCHCYIIRYDILQWPMRKIQHTRECDWQWTWLNRTTVKGGL